MRKRTKTWIAVCAGLLGILVVLVGIRLANPPVLEEIPFVKVQDSGMDGRERQAFVKKIQGNQPEFEVVDTVYGKRTDLVWAAAVCRNVETGSESWIAIQMRDGGLGFIEANAENHSLKFESCESLRIMNSDTIAWTLIDRKKMEQYDYTVKASKEGTNFHFQLDSAVRQVQT